jgi:hypothetical protein
MGSSFPKITAESRGPPMNRACCPTPAAPDLGVLLPVVVQVAVDPERPPEPGARVGLGVLVEVPVAEPVWQLVGLGHALQHMPDGPAP